jgi:hypothetical protein
MGIVLLKIGKPSPLSPDESVLLEQRRFRIVSSYTPPSYRIGFNLPPLWRISLVVTNKRCLALTDLFHCMTQEISMWYPGQNPEGDPETITGVRCASALFGRYLEVRTNNPDRRRGWLWSPDLTLRFFFRGVEEFESTILDAMRRAAGGGTGKA